MKGKSSKESNDQKKGTNTKGGYIIIVFCCLFIAMGEIPVARFGITTDPISFNETPVFFVGSIIWLLIMAGFFIHADRKKS